MMRLIAFEFYLFLYLTSVQYIPHAPVCGFSFCENTEGTQYNKQKIYSDNSENSNLKYLMSYIWNLWCQISRISGFRFLCCENKISL